MRIGNVEVGRHVAPVLIAELSGNHNGDLDRALALVDAMAAAGLGPGTYRLGEREVVVGSDMIVRGPDGYLAGSAATMARSAANLREHLGFSDDTVHRLTSTNPRLAIGLAP